MRLKSNLLIALILSTLVAGSAFAVVVEETEGSAPTNWTAPPYWAPAAAQNATASGRTALVPSGSTPLPFVALNPCRLVDTRGLPAALPGGGFLPAATVRNYTLVGACGIPAGAKAISLNATVTNPTGAGFLVLWDKGGPVPGVSTLNFLAGQTIANAAVVPLSADGSLSVALGNAGGDVILDTNGYYTALSAVTSLNTQTGALTLTAGSNVTITPGAGSLTIATSVAAGATGPSGPSGPAGLTGATGPSGPAGIAGATGPSGPAGVAGSTGPAGVAGATGPQGVAGTTGATGPQGLTGLTGATGATGPQGLTGLTGATGATGPAGTNGADGANGKTVLSGIVDPTTEGVDGDFYINTASNTIFGPKAAGVWPTPGTSVVGPSGPSGPLGPSGPAGPSGPSGPQGDPGVTGATGPSGPAGIAGPTGPSGPAGAAGPSGPSGPQGLTGLTGATGPSGPSGPSGPTGPVGVYPTRTVTATATLLDTDRVVFCSPVLATTLTLPSAASNPGLEITVRRLNTTNVNCGVTPVATTENGGSNTYNMNQLGGAFASGDKVTVLSDGTTWHIMSIH